MGRRIAGYEVPDSLNDHTPIQAQASALKRQFEAGVAAARADTRLSDEGKQTSIALAWQAFKPAFDALRQQEEADYAKAVSKRYSTLVGMRDRDDPNAVISFRDAMQRVESLPHGNGSDADRRRLTAQVEKLLSRAQLSGDDILTRAVLAEAIDRSTPNPATRSSGDGFLLDLYKQHHPEDAAAIDDYYELLRYDPSTSMQAHYTWKADRPREISRYDLTDEDIAKIASRSVGLEAATTDRAASQGYVTHADRVAWGQ